MKLFIIIILFMVSCNNSPMDTHICTKEQMLKAEKEVKFCIDINTAYSVGTCYNSAIRRNCEKRGSDESIKH